MGIGYHYFVRKDGSVWQGRPDDVVGAHAGTKNGYNTHSVGICFEGEYQEKDKVMPDAQMKAGAELIRYLLEKYPNCSILRHQDVSPTTDCPGKNFPFAALKAAGLEKPEDNSGLPDDLDLIAGKGIIQSPGYWSANATAGGTVKGEYAAGLIHNMAEFIRKI
jgi:N-acetyl-anhydromuramyl-L-alanine amidase AmpD